MRKVIAALQTSLDGFIEGPKGELDWVDSWEDPFDLLSQIDACILGGGMYPGYEQYWGAVHSDPDGVLPFVNRRPTAGEIVYAQFATATPHIVLSRTLKHVEWKNTRIVRDADEIRAMKQRPGKDMYAVGGAALVSSLMNLGLVDEIRLVVQPVILGAGKSLFGDVSERHSLTLVESTSLGSGMVRLTYQVQPT